MKKLILFLLTIIIFSSCGDFKDVSFSGIENVKVNKMSKERIDIDIIAKIKNPNKMAFTIYKSDMDAVVSGVNIGKAHLTKKVKIKANTEQAYTFNVKSNFSKINMGELPNLMALLTKKSLKIGLKGDLKVGKLFVKKTHPVDMTKDVPLSILGGLNLGGLLGQ